ncbi:MAG: DUF5683 domain-containing protein [Balneolaceae bacterium]
MTEPDTTSYGFIKITVTNLDSFYVVVNEDFETIYSVSSGDSLKIVAGRNQVRIFQRSYADIFLFRRIEENRTNHLVTNILPLTRPSWEVQSRSSYPKVFWGGENFILSDPGTDLYIDDEYIGTEYAVIDTVGNFTVTGITDSGERFTRTYSTLDKTGRFNVYEHSFGLKKSRVRALSLLPGASQAYKGQTIKAISISAVAAAAVFLAINYENTFQSRWSEFTTTRQLYNRAADPSEVFRLGNEADALFRESQRASRNRNRVLIGASVLYLYNVIDGNRTPSVGYRTTRFSFDPYLDIHGSDPIPSVRINQNF